ncbi:hypothetical protein J7E62_14840 [Variovorax paradoxus]|nr:hypothetical protein [Variovorax paradoxus]
MYMSYEAPHGSFPQPIDLLQRLASTSLPIHIVDDGEIETLRILKLGGTIKAAIPDAQRLPGGLDCQRGQLSATVSEITRLGRSLLSRFASPCQATSARHSSARRLEAPSLVSP